MTSKFFDRAETAIRDVFGDTSQSRDDTRDDLEALKSGIEDLLELLGDDDE